MRPNHLIAFALIAVSSCSAVALAADAPATFQPPEKAKFKVFLLVGQSNMAGRGKVEAQDQKPHPRVWKLDKQDRWVPATDPLHFDKPIAGVGLGTTFGKTIADQHPGDVIGLVPCAVGGTSINQWASNKEKGLYAEAIRRAKVALKDGTLAGILWHQGESDMKSPEGYAEKAKKLFADFRRDLAAPETPVVVGALGEFIASAERINSVLRTLPEVVPNCGYVESKGLVDKGDKVHFDSASLRELGNRYASKWAELTKSKAAARSK